VAPVDGRDEQFRAAAVAWKARVHRLVAWARQRPLVAAIVAAIAVVALVAIMSSMSGASDQSAVTQTWQRFVHLADTSESSFSSSDGTAVASLLAPNSPACDANCSDPGNINIAGAVAPYTAQISDITINGNTATATVEGVQTAQFAKDGGAWQISMLPNPTGP
jgi:hypothetical protein